MSRKLQPIQVITYPKKIVYRRPENNAKNFFNTFLGIFLVNILIVLASVATSGIGTSIAVGLEVSQLNQALISTSFQALVNFSVSSTFDLLRGDLTSENLLFNALFAVTDLGKIGRGLKEDKLIKLLNQSDLLKRFGFNQEIKNFYQLQQFLKMKQVFLKDKTKLVFKKTISNSELLESIFLVADSELKKELKSLSYDQLKTLLDIEKAIYKLSPEIIANSGPSSLERLDKALKKELDIGYNDFLKLDDLEAVNALFKLQSSRIGQKTLNQLNLIRMQSKFQRSLYQTFKDSWKNLKNKSEKLNPIYWTKKVLAEMVQPLDNIWNEIRKKSLKYFPNLNEIGRKLIKENNLIPCQVTSFLLGFKFEPATADGAGYITIYKKPYVWKKNAPLNYYNPVKIWTNLLEVKEFVESDNQDIFYRKNWVLDYGFGEGTMTNILLARLGVGKIYRHIQRFDAHIKKLMIILDSGFPTYTRTITEQAYQRLWGSRISNPILQGSPIAPSNSPITSSIIKSLREGKWNYSWARNGSAKLPSQKSLAKE